MPSLPLQNLFQLPDMLLIAFFYLSALGVEGKTGFLQLVPEGLVLL